MTLDVKILGDAESARFMVVFLHGYGADGQDLLGLGQVMGDDLPDTIFAAPDAPHPCLINPLGRAWFAIPAFDGSEISFAESQMRVSIDALHNWLDKASRDFNIPAAAYCFVWIFPRVHDGVAYRTPPCGARCWGRWIFWTVAVCGRIIGENPRPSARVFGAW